MLDETSMAALLEAFLLESEEGLAATEEALLELERDPEDAEALALVFRGVHTIKGNAGIFDFDALSAVAHAMEDLLDGVRSGRTRPSQAVMSVLIEAVDTLRILLVEEDRTRGVGPREQSLIDRLTASTHHSVSVHAASSQSARKSHTLRIDIGRLDRLLDLSGEIGVSRGRVAQMLDDPAIPRRLIAEAQRDADLLHLEMQELVMKLRMVPVGPSFRQLHRTVRDAAQLSGRSAELRIEGGDVEVDMTIVEHLRDPLIHMIRNCVGHGIEPAEVRRAAGKPPVGQLLLRSSHDSRSIVVELSDDGAGIDRQRVAERAVERGLIAEGHNLSEREVLDLIFHPGFSTADEVTELSGRGVGLDVVRRNIDAIHGSVTVDSTPGAGTTLTLRLPLTLAIVQGLLVRVAGQPFIIPMDLVVEAIRMPESDRTAATGVLSHRNESLPFVRLRHRLAHADGAAARENAVVVRHGGGYAALVVDLLDGECQSVVKPLPRSVGGIAGLSGSTILADGSIAFIVDVFTLLEAEIDRGRAHFSHSSNNAMRTRQESSCSAN